MKKGRQAIYKEALMTWVSLNAFLKDAGEEDCRGLFIRERNGKRRPAFLRRIHCRLNRVRADREREELQEDLA